MEKIDHQINVALFLRKYALRIGMILFIALVILGLLVGTEVIVLPVILVYYGFQAGLVSLIIFILAIIVFFLSVKYQ
jgi:phosphoglycerol transferase MdoB-like AlkP superfamily enzyme